MTKAQALAAMKRASDAEDRALRNVRKAQQLLDIAIDKHYKAYQVYARMK